jgi:hypothetical protein
MRGENRGDWRARANGQVAKDHRVRDTCLHLCGVFVRTGKEDADRFPTLVLGGPLCDWDWLM